MSNDLMHIPFCGVCYEHPYLVIRVLIDFKGRPYKSLLPVPENEKIQYVTEHAYRTLYVRGNQILSIDNCNGNITIYTENSEIDIFLWNYEAFNPTYGEANQAAIAECSEFIVQTLVNASKSDTHFTPEPQSRTYPVPFITELDIEKYE